jgi:hypothetical protein
LDYLRRSRRVLHGAGDHKDFVIRRSDSHHFLQLAFDLLNFV